MLVCICKGISDKQIRQSLEAGASSFREIRSELGVGSCCGQCAPYARELIEETLARDSFSSSIKSFDLAYEAVFSPA